jgi:hypothetical protein
MTSTQAGKAAGKIDRQRGRSAGRQGRTRVTSMVGRTHGVDKYVPGWCDRLNNNDKIIKMDHQLAKESFDCIV